MRADTDCWVLDLTGERGLELQAVLLQDLGCRVEGSGRRFDLSAVGRVGTRRSLMGRRSTHVAGGEGWRDTLAVLSLAQDGLVDME